MNFRIESIIFIFQVKLIFVLSQGLYSILPGDTEEQIGRISYVDEIINRPDILKAICFSVNYKDEIYKEVLAEAIHEITHKLLQSQDPKEQKLLDYYVYVLKNVQKYTSRWLVEEIQNLTQKTNSKEVDEFSVAKRNIVEFIYFTASDFGVDLAMRNEDISLNDWKQRQEENKINILKSFHSEL